MKQILAAACPVAYPFDTHFSYTDLNDTFSSTATVPSSINYGDMCPSKGLLYR